MGLQDWKGAFYSDVEGAKGWTDKQCFEHTLKKYKGLKKENLNKYGVQLSGAVVRRDQSEEFFLGTDTCSLCTKYYGIEDDTVENECSICPLDQAGYGCFTNDEDEDHKNLWAKMYDENDPTEMIQQMKKMIGECAENGEWVK